jgi:hypothetical protein
LGLNSGETNLREGSPGEILSRIKIKQTIKKRTNKEENNLFKTRRSILLCSIGLILYCPIPAMMD